MAINVGSAYGTLGLNVDGVTRGSQQAQQQINKLGGVVQNVFQYAMGNVAFAAMRKLTTGLESTAKQIVMTAARADEMDKVLGVLGAKAGRTADEMRDFVDSVREGGIRLDVAQDLVAQFTRYQLNLADATDLARTAQDAAVLGMMDSSEALQNIVYGITTFNARVLRTVGLNVNMQEAFDKMASSLGKTTQQLSITEKQQAALNAVNEAGVAIQGAYEAAMESGSKQLRSFPRYIYDIYLAIGEPFTDAFSNAVFTVKALLKTMGELVGEGGVLYPVLQRLGAVAAVVTGEFRRFVEGLVSTNAKIRETAQAVGGSGQQIALTARETGEQFVTNLIGKLSTAASKAATWGVNISTQLATGLVRGAAAALTAAMRFIGNLLSSWLAPGSPPMVAPDIDAWGAAAFGEYLQGFTQADFDILTGIQRPLQSALSELAGLGEIADDAVGSTFTRLTYEMTAAIGQFERTGQVGTEVFESLRKSGGRFGDQLAEMLRRQLAVAGAVKEAEEAERQLDEARKGEERLEELQAELDLLEAQYDQVRESGVAAAQDAEDAARKQVDEVERLKKEYRELLAAGADSGILRAKEEEIRAAMRAADQGKQQHKEVLAQGEEQLALVQASIDAKQTEVAGAEAGAQAAEMEAQAAQAAYDAAMERVHAAEEQARLQDAILQQMFDTTHAIEQATDAASDLSDAMEDVGAGAGGEEIEPPDTGAFTGAIDVMTDKLTAFDGLKEQFRARLAEMFAPLRQAWETDMLPAIQGVGERWDWFTGIVKQFWDERVSPLVEDIKGLIPEGLAEDIGEVGGVAAVAAAGFIGLSLVVGALSAAFGLLTSPIVLIIGAITLLYMVWKRNLFGIRDALTDVWERILKPTFEAFRQIIVEDVWPKLQEAFTNIKEAFGGLGIEFASTGEVIRTIFGVLAAGIMLAVGIIAGVINGLAAVINTLAATWVQVREAIGEVLGGIQTLVVEFGRFIRGVLTGDFEDLSSAWENFLDGMRRYATGALKLLYIAVVTPFNELIAFVGGFVEAIINFFLNLKEQLVGGSIVPEMMEMIYNIIVERMTALLEYWITQLTALYVKAKEWFDTIVGKVREFAENVYDAIFDKIEALRLWWAGGKGKKGVWQQFKETFEEALSKLGELADTFIAPVLEAFEWLKKKIGGVIEAVAKLIALLKSVEIPDWMKGHSPPPIAQAFIDANDAMNAYLRTFQNMGRLMNSVALPAMMTSPPVLTGIGVGSGEAGPTFITVYGGLTATGVSDARSFLDEIVELALMEGTR